MAFPSRLGDSGIEDAKMSGMEVTAAGTAPVFHRIPLRHKVELPIWLLIPWTKVILIFILQPLFHKKT